MTPRTPALRILVTALVALFVWIPPVAAASGAPAVAVDPMLRLLLDASPAAASGVTAAAGPAEPRVPRSLTADGTGLAGDAIEVFVEGALPASIAGAGSALDLGGGIHALRVSPADLRAILGAESVTAARLSRPLRPLLDQSRIQLGVASAWRETGTLEYTGTTGRGVVVGIVDSGLDVHHPDFQFSDRSTRVAWYWNQLADTRANPPGYSFGREWSAELIDLGEEPGRDIDGHGTHVAGIAAGNGRASAWPPETPHYVGVAPEATLIAVQTAFTEYAVALGVHYVFNRAAAMGAPAVVNLSLGHQSGPHDGNSPFERTLDNLSGPGRIIVVAAGNDAERDQHAEVVLDPQESEEIGVEFPTYNTFSPGYFYVDVEFWYDFDSRFLITVLDPDGMEVGSLRSGGFEGRFPGPRGYTRVWTGTDMGKGYCYVEIERELNDAGHVASGTWTLRLDSLEGAPRELDARLSGWYFNREQEPRFTSHVDVEETVTVPATAKRVIAVGAVNSRDCWPATGGATRCFVEPGAVGEIAPFSSLGPTQDGRPKPEILAPGRGVVSARSTSLAESLYDPADLAARTTPDGSYWVLSGTSMAAPQVTGTVALLLQQHPDLTPEQAADRLRGRGRSGVDPRTGDAVSVLQTGAALRVPTRLLFTDIRRDPEGVALSWTADKGVAPVEFVVRKGFSLDGPFFELRRDRIEGENPFRVVDTALEPGRLHIYRIGADDGSGVIEDLDTLRIDVPGIPATVLRAPEPNPSSGPVTVRFYVAPSPGGAPYRLDVLDVAGRRVLELDRGMADPAGAEFVRTWDGRNGAGRPVAPGVYWIRLAADGGGARPPGIGGSGARKVVIVR